MKIGSYSPACNTWFDALADKQAQVDNILSDLPANKKDEAMTSIINSMSKQPGKAGLIASEFIINGYLSGPATPAVNAISALTQMIIQPVIRTVEAFMPSAATKVKTVGPEGTAVYSQAEKKYAGEGLAMIRGIMQGFGEAMAFAKSGWVTGRPLDVNMHPKAWGMTEGQFRKFVNENYLPEERAEMLKTQLYDYAQKQIPGTVGDAIRLPTKVGIFIDEFNKAIFRRMEYNALAYRKAADIASKTGEDSNAIYNKLIADRFTVENWQSKIKENLGVTKFTDVQAFAKENVFQEKLTGFAATIANARAEHPWSVLIVPFVKTPYNILKEGVSYIPGTAPLIKKEIRDSGKFEFALKMPEQRSKLLAKQAIGLGAAVYLTSLANQGLITGSEPKDGRPPFSIKVGDSWVSYQKIEPLATVFGMTADAVKIINDYRDNKNPDKNAKEYLSAYAEAIKNNIFEKSFMEGLSKAIFAMTDAERHGEAFLTSYANAIVPAISATTARLSDKYERESTTFLERAQSRIPGLRENLPIKYKMTGGPEEPSVSNALIGIKTVTPTSVEQTLSSLNVDIAPSPKKLKGVELTTEQYSRLKELSGTLIAQEVERLKNNPRFMEQDKYKKEVDMDKAISRAKKTAGVALSNEIYKTDPTFAKKYYNALIEKYGLQEIRGYQQ